MSEFSIKKCCYVYLLKFVGQKKLNFVGQCNCLQLSKHSTANSSFEKHIGSHRGQLLTFQTTVFSIHIVFVGFIKH
jgi:hypothetical protein